MIIGNCILFYNYPDDRNSDADEESIVAQCVAIGFPDPLTDLGSSRSSANTNTNTNACGAVLDKKTVSPTQCFEPDASTFYNFKGSRTLLPPNIYYNPNYGGT